MIGMIDATEPYMILIILTVGLAGGFINVVAGGGSLITTPTLILLGMPSAVANGTNRIALIFQNTSALYNFKRHGYFPWRLGLLYGVPAAIGALLGAQIANNIAGDTFNNILAVVMILMLLITLFRPEKHLSKLTTPDTTQMMILGASLFFFIGIYGGFIQVGTGFFIIAALSVLTGADLKNINSIKVIVILIYILSSITLFIYYGNYDLIVGLILATGMAIGGYLGSHFTLQVDERYVRAVITITVIALSLKLLGIY